MKNFLKHLFNSKFTLRQQALKKELELIQRLELELYCDYLLLKAQYGTPENNN